MHISIQTMTNNFNLHPNARATTLLRYLCKTAQLALLMGASIPILQAGGLYEGERNSFGRFDGQGTYTNGRGDEYKGQWQDGVKSGIGTLTKSNGEIYTGRWLENKRNGNGEQRFKNGDVYKGQWIYNKRNGLGSFFYTNGNVYEGSFESNQRHKNGSMQYVNGDQFQGVWSYGKRNGKGTYQFKNGDQLNGLWAQEKFAHKGQFIFKSGLIYDGPIVNLKPHGAGLCSNTQLKSSSSKKTRPCQFRSGKQINLVAAKKAAPTQRKPQITRKVSQAAPKIAALPKPIPALVPAPAPTPKSASASKPSIKAKSVSKPTTEKSAVYKASKPEFGFNHNWKGAPQSEQALKVWHQETASYKNQLRINSEGKDYSISIRIQDYDGPGLYSIGYYDVRVNNSSKNLYASNQESSGKVHITQDNKKFISGTFSLNVFPNGNPNLNDTIELRNGFFTIAKKSPQK